MFRHRRCCNYFHGLDVIKTLILVSSLWISCVSSFTITTRNAFLLGQNSRVAASSSSELDLGRANSAPPSSTKQIELWLDLRGTAVHPRVAVGYIIEELEEKLSPPPSKPTTLSTDESLPTKNSNLIDKVILSDNHFQQLVESLDPYTQIEDVLYIPEETKEDLEGNNLVALSQNGVSFPFGTLIGVPRDSCVAIADPIQSLQDLSKGNWILFVSEDEKGESLEQVNAMGNFLDIASTASLSWGATTELESGLLIQAADTSSSGCVGHGDDEDDGQGPRKSGGVAIKCSSRECVLQLASIFQTAQSASSAVTSTTDSGILIQECLEEEEEEQSSPVGLSMAMILPFDLSVWEAASLMYGEDQDDVVVE